jgi:type VI protein secretion system component VasK
MTRIINLILNKLGFNISSTKISASDLHLKLELKLLWYYTIIGLLIIFIFDISFNFKGNTSPWSIIISFWIILLIISIIYYLIKIIRFFLIRKYPKYHKDYKYHKDLRKKYNLKDPEDRNDLG